MRIWLVFAAPLLSILALLGGLFAARKSLGSPHLSFPIRLIPPLLRVARPLALAQWLLSLLYSNNVLTVVNRTVFKARQHLVAVFLPLPAYVLFFLLVVLLRVIARLLFRQWDVMKLATI